MTAGQQTAVWIFAACVAIWPIRHVALFFILKRLHILTPASPRFEADDPPLVSAIIPACNEEETLADCLATVSAQSYPNLEILIVDDRSVDRTAAVAAAIAGADDRVRVVSIRELPPGWTGKTHALHVAVAGANGEWLWFVDSDTLHEPDSLSITMEYARRERASLASLLIELRCESFWERVVQPLAGIVLAQWYPLMWVNDDRNKLAFANGQYILIRRDAYDLAGGHESVRDKFVEDIHLARRVKGLGLPIRVAIGRDIGSTRMYTTFSQILRGWARILYDASGRRTWLLALGILDGLLFCTMGDLALIAGAVLFAFSGPKDFALWLIGLGILNHLLATSVLARVYRLSVRRISVVAWYPLASLIIDLILLRSIRMCLTGRVTWRGTSYGRNASTGSGSEPMTSTRPAR